LYVVVRKDLLPSYRSVQATHSAIQFQHEFPEISKKWQTKSNTLALLTAKDEQHLIDLMYKAKIKNINYSIFTEPDLNYEITSVTFDPSEASGRLLSGLPTLDMVERTENFQNIWNDMKIKCYDICNKWSKYRKELKLTDYETNILDYSNKDIQELHFEYDGEDLKIGYEVYWRCETDDSYTYFTLDEIMNENLIKEKIDNIYNKKMKNI